MIDSTLRETLNSLASEYYMATKRGDTERTQEIAREIGLDTMGGDILGTGGGRNVFDMYVLGHPNKCLKLAVPHSDWDGLGQNKREIYLWNSLSTEKKAYLAPVLDSGPQNYWLVMEKGQPVNTLPYEWLQDAKYHLRDIIWEKDMGEDNIVKINGEFKFCDYGTGP